MLKISNTCVSAVINLRSIISMKVRNAVHNKKNLYYIECNTEDGSLVTGYIDNPHEFQMNTFYKFYNIRMIDVSNSDIDRIPITMRNLHTIIANNSKLKTIPELDSLRTVDVRDTHVKGLSPRMEKQLKTILGDFKKDDIFLL